MSGTEWAFVGLLAALVVLFVWAGAILSRIDIRGM